MGTLLLALACCLPQSAASSVQTSSAVLVSGVVEEGRVPLRAFGLGDGGVGDAVRSPQRSADGQFLTPGGILVRAQAEGVKLDFPSGRELLIGVDAAVHLRSGERTAPCLHGLELWLADGVRVHVEREPTPRLPLRLVEVITPDASTVLWRARRQTTEASIARRAAGVTFLALGAGDTLYTAVPLGPLIVLQRQLCAAAERAERPPQRVVVCGDPLAESLQRLPSHSPRGGVQFPTAQEAGERLAALASVLFERGLRARPPGPSGAMIFDLPEDFRLRVVDHAEGAITIGLMLGDVDVPAVEWLVAARTTVQLVRPGGGAGGGARYVSSGLDLTEPTRALLPVTVSLADIAKARGVLRSLGAR